MRMEQDSLMWKEDIKYNNKLLLRPVGISTFYWHLNQIVWYSSLFDLRPTFRNDDIFQNNGLFNTQVPLIVNII